MNFYPENISKFKLKALEWASLQDICMSLNGNNFETFYAPFPDWIAIGKKREILSEGGNSFEKLEAVLAEKKGYWFGFLSYDLKNDIENLISKNTDLLSFPYFYFFEPLVLLKFSDSSVEILAENAREVFSEINKTEMSLIAPSGKLIFSEDQTKEEYLFNVNKIKNHILEGDIYELNYCLRFLSENAKISPVAEYQKLLTFNPSPFSFFFNSKTHSIISASPERFLKKIGTKVISQPMKGTISRGRTQEEDEIQKEKLLNSEKERAENMMIVDLVRNDLAKSCKSGTVKVEEIFGIYPFPAVFQMISTISGEIRENVSPVEVIKNAYPMGSMTGAPKIRAMELIDNYEKSYRGVFSGAAGYFTPEGDFDLNVIIRSIFYNKPKELISIAAGSAITFDSDPDTEYQECLLKANALLKLLQ